MAIAAGSVGDMNYLRQFKEWRHDFSAVAESVANEVKRYYIVAIVH